MIKALNINQFSKHLFFAIAALTSIIGIIHHLIFPIPEHIQWIFFTIIIILTGIPHGALDHEVAKQNSLLNNRLFSARKFHGKYVGLMFLYGLGWYFFPTISFYVFLFISAFHFGETDVLFDSPKTNLLGVLLQITYGLLILFIILFVHIDAVLPILQRVNIFSPLLISYLQHDQISIIAISSSFSLFALTLIVFYVVNKQISFDLKRIFLLIIFVLISALILPLPLCFIIYFGLWHSVTSLENIRQHLSKTKTESLSWKALMIKCVPLTGISLVGLFSLILLLDLDKNINLVIMGLFIGISILTLPHQEVMSKMYFQVRQKRT